jgi:hypothetical protein
VDKNVVRSKASFSKVAMDKADTRSAVRSPTTRILTTIMKRKNARDVRRQRKNERRKRKSDENTKIVGEVVMVQTVMKTKNAEVVVEAIAVNIMVVSDTTRDENKSMEVVMVEETIRESLVACM